LVEYDPGKAFKEIYVVYTTTHVFLLLDTLSPLGLVVDRETLRQREVLVVEEGTVLVLVEPKSKNIEVVHPNDDGTYWRKVQRNKKVRQEEKLREQVAKKWFGKPL